MHQPTQPREPRTADRLGIPIPEPDGDQRAAWFTELGTVIGVDCLGIAAQQLAAGASPSATEQLLRGLSGLAVRPRRRRRRRVPLSRQPLRRLGGRVIPDEPLPPRVVLTSAALVHQMPQTRTARYDWVAELEGAFLNDTRIRLAELREQRAPEGVLEAYCGAAAHYYCSRVRSAIESALLDDWLVRS